LRKRDRLTALTVRQIAEPGLHPDGGGLHLQVSPSGTKSWILKFQLNRRARAMGLGSVHITSLAEARAARDAAHRLLRDGVDPIEVRKAELQRRRAEPPKTMTFREAAIACMKDLEAGWRNWKHAQQWPASLTEYAYPIIGDLPVQAIDTALVMNVLQQEIHDEGSGRLQLWRARPETASRLRGRIEAILDWAKVRKLRDGDNPARWRGHLDKLLPKKSRVAKVKPHSAIDYREIAAFMATLRTDEDDVGARGLEFAILTAARTGEVIGARWTEIDFKTAVWTVPGTRMKAGKEHRVPLSGAAMAILEGEKKHAWGEFVFMTPDARPLWVGALLHRLQRTGYDVTTHGMRAAFKTWASERTSYATDAIELSLAHTVGSKVEAAYRRTDLFEKRRRMMDDWAEYCGTVAAPDVENVVPLRAVASVPG
jgi:integrase